MALPLRYSVRSLAARPTRTALTASVIALVVMASTLFLGLVSSLRRTLATTGHPLNLVVMRKGSDNDGSSQISLEAYQAIRFANGIARSSDGRYLASPELVVQPFFKTNDGGRENVLVRGVEAVALDVHHQVKIISGRMLKPSSGEAIVGRNVAGRYAGATLGDELEFGRGRWKVVGIFAAEGSSFESEVWVDVRELANDAHRTFPFSGVRVRARDADALAQLRAQVEANPRYAIEAEREVDYYAKQSDSANTLYVLVIGIATLAGIGAGFGAANTMYAAVRARTAEIGTLRALGFSRLSILTALELEAAILGLLGFGLGAVCALGLAALLRHVLGGIAFGAATFTTNVITLELAPGDFVAALGLALVIGAIPAVYRRHGGPLDFSPRTRCGEFDGSCTRAAR